MTSTDFDQYRSSLDKLETAFKEALQKKSHTDALAQQVSNTLRSRDRLEAELEKNRLVPLNDIPLIAKADREFRSILNQIFNWQWIDFASWRSIHGSGADGKWWWCIDQERLSAELTPGHLIRQIFYGLLAILLLLFLRDRIYDTTSRIVAFFGGALAQNGAQIGSNMITVLTIVVQLVFGGGVSLAFTNNITKFANQFLARLFLLLPRGLGRIHIRGGLFQFLPVTRFFVGTVLFVATVLLIPDLVLKPIAKQLRESAATLQQPVDAMLNTLANASNIDPDPDYAYALDLTRIGLHYESLGDYTDALQTYEQALATSPNQIYTAYRVAEIELLLNSMDRVTELHVLDIIDQAEQTITTYENKGLQLSDINISEDGYVTQLQMLLLLNRAKLLENLGALKGALHDLHSAEAIAKAHPDLFRLPGITPTSTEIAPISTVELYYLMAKNYDQQANLTNSAKGHELAQTAWLNVLKVANPNVGRELIWIGEADTATSPQSARP